MGKWCVVLALCFLLACGATARNIPDNALAPNTQKMAVSAASPAANGGEDQKNFITFGGIGGWAGVGGLVGFIPVLGGIGGVGGGTVPAGGVGGVGGGVGGVGGGGILP